MNGMTRPCVLGIGLLVLVGGDLSAQAGQPPIGSSPAEPRWPDLLRQIWGLDVDRDLRNPLLDNVATPCAFVRADKSRSVRCTPIIALGMETTTHGGWYAGEPRENVVTTRRELWSYAHKQPQAECTSGRFTPPPLKTGGVEFDPGGLTFGFWVSNESWNDGGVYTNPSLTARVNQRLRSQPYKAMIYPNRDPAKGTLVADSYIIGWEYSTNDDFQDVVMQVDNVKLVSTRLHEILAEGTPVKKLAGGFAFVEGPAWSPNENALYFSDIPRSQIVRYADGKTTIATDRSGRSNGLMFDRQGRLVACEGADTGGGRRISRGAPGRPLEDVATRYNGRRFNSPNDLWIDAAGGIYFTDPRYGRPDDRELDKEAVYYVAADGKVTCVIDDLVRPNGIALSPDGRFLYVIDNGANSLHRYPTTAPGRIGRGERIAYVNHPDGMSVDVRGRLYVTGEGGIWVLDADGKWLGLIETPELPANCTFGGPGWRTLFITARTSLYGIDTKTRGWHLHLDGMPPEK